MRDEQTFPDEKKTRAYRKGNPLTSTERKDRYNIRMRETHKLINLYVENDVKTHIESMCREGGLTQSELIGLLVMAKVKSENKKARVLKNKNADCKNSKKEDKER
ncbi:RepB family protein [Yersinia intermedia]|uniref:RepB family protein n=1 Tax=Yersinia intermedia TaxID=631 RepID=UPI000B732610|nr:RepB family protein [Yersinia intermedia]MCW8114198.1 replication protein [Yersinia intermedia]MDA5518970.1 replication protein [Yersinia intermedia]OWF87148.1 hypothetical protein B4916_21945 [Yersinia intermedia]